MKIAIHDSHSRFSDEWIKFAIESKISYEIVDMYDSNIMAKIRSYDGLMWHWQHNDYRAQIAAREIILSVEQLGIPVFPDYRTCWHYDDKVAQKYLLEAIGAPLVPTYVFYDAEEALRWIENTEWPIVFKLRGGAGASNVKLIRNEKDAVKVIKKMFGKGYPYACYKNDLKERLWVLRRDKNKESIVHLMKGLCRVLIPKPGYSLLPTQKGYVYFQKFLSGNNHDVRVYTFGNKAFTTVRYNRENDFRASGSGKKNYDPNLIDKEYLEIAFSVSEKLGLQSCAYDMLKYESKVYIVEISYCFGHRGLTGYWDRNLEWHEHKISLEHLIAENFIESIKK